jgi:Tol biopolymer transport system component
VGGVGQAAELYVVPAAGGTARRLTGNARPERGATWSPRGDHVAYSLPGGLAPSHVPAPTEPEEIWAIDIRTGAQRKLADGFDPAWAPDGSRLAYATNGRRTDDGATDNAIHLVQADGSGERPVLSVSALPLDLQPAYNHPFRPGTVRLRAPAWAPDGQHLVASADGHTGMTVTVDERGQNLRPLALAYEGGVGRARWAPHGGRLLIESRPATGVDVALVVDAVSGSERRIGGIQEGFSTRAVTWAPDSSRLAVVAGPPTERPGSDPDPVELRLYAADGSPIRTMASGHIADPDWGSAEP